MSEKLRSEPEIKTEKKVKLPEFIAKSELWEADKVKLWERYIAEKKALIEKLRSERKATGNIPNAALWTGSQTGGTESGKISGTDMKTLDNKTQKEPSSNPGGEESFGMNNGTADIPLRIPLSYSVKNEVTRDKSGNHGTSNPGGEHGTGPQTGGVESGSVSGADMPIAVAGKIERPDSNPDGSHGTGPQTGGVDTGNVSGKNMGTTPGGFNTFSNNFGR